VLARREAAACSVQAAGSLFAMPLAAGVTGDRSRRSLDKASQDTVARLGVPALAGYVTLFGLGLGLLGVSGLSATEGLGRTVLVSSVLVCSPGLVVALVEG